MGFCPRCGRPSRNNELCEECRLELEGVRYKDFKIVQCSVCKRILYKNRWIPEEEAIPRIVKDKLLDKWYIKQYKLGKKLIVILEKNNFEGIIEADIEKRICPTCSKKRGDYYEAILQVRGENAVKKMDKIKKKSEIYKEQRQKNGIDYYYYFSREAKKALAQLKRQLPGIVKISRKLHSYDKQRSKKIYRLTILFREKE